MMGKRLQLVFCNIAKRVLALVMLFGVVIISFPYAISVSPDDIGEPSPLPFVDVEPTDWFYEQVRDVFEQGLMVGTGDVIFNPRGRVTRAMAVQVLYNHRGQPDVSERNPPPFTDVAEDAWYYDAVTWAWGNSVVRGFGDGTFAPHAYITRAHLVVLINNYSRNMSFWLPPQRDSQPFVDDIDIRNYAKEAIDRFFRAMVINGRPDGRFDPNGNATRAELATMLSQFVRYGRDASRPQPPYGFPCDDCDCSAPLYGFPEPPDDDVVTPDYGFPYSN